MRGQSRPTRQICSGRDEGAERATVAGSHSTRGDARGGRESGRMAELQESFQALIHVAADLCERLAEALRELQEARTKVVEVEGYCRELENEQGRIQADRELETFRAVARETQKWEDREARLVKRLEELERGAVVMLVATGTRGRAGDREGRGQDSPEAGMERDCRTPVERSGELDSCAS